ncbi:MAG: rhodanese-related sulfurtransferase [Parachlamydiales bacterium]|jgi:UPF0176 protein
MTQQKIYYVLAYYAFITIEDPHSEVKLHKLFLSTRDASCRIYISEEGINGQLCLEKSDAEAYMDWMKERTLFRDVVFKIHTYHEHVYPRVTIKYRKQLVALDKTVDLKNAGQHISPLEWRQKMEGEQKPFLLDVRNHYEWLVGHFEGAVSPECDNFREFDEYADKLVNEIDPKTTPVMMCCTGGIRCELYSALLKEKGFEEVYQLDGGIINYGLREGSSHWLGKLFVFDDRLTVPISDEPAPTIAVCKHCQVTAENYYNCANMDCNELFICCPDCLHQFEGCCDSACKNAPRIRPYHQEDAHKPFRRWHHYFEDKPQAEVGQTCQDQA